MKPKFLTKRELEELKNDNPNLQIEDSIDLAIGELFDIDFPEKKDTKKPAEVEQYSAKLTSSPDDWGDWVYYPWLQKVVHFPPKKQLRQLRTSRNRNLITADEQTKLYEATILVAGMSVGSNVVEALVSQGIGSTLILADMDIIEPSNLNRIRSPYHQVGLHKVEAISRKVWEVDPHINIVQLLDGLNESILDKALKEHSIDILVDEVDDLKLKVIIRERAAANSLPVVMAADDGDNILLDIERFDKKKDIEFFHGLVPEEVLDKIRNQDIPRAELGMMIGKYFVGLENTPLRMFQSLSEIGKSLPSWPQLGGAAALAGITIAYTIRKILLDEQIKDGRILVSLDEKIDLEHQTKEHQDELKRFMDMMGA